LESGRTSGKREGGTLGQNMNAGDQTRFPLYIAVRDSAAPKKRKIKLRSKIRKRIKSKSRRNNFASKEIS
jgi:hypothetical protein